VFDAIAGDLFSASERGVFRPLLESLLTGGDHYMLLADYAEYVATQERVDALYADRDAWTRAAILNIAAMGTFSSDRAIREYAEGVWRVQPISF